jgi:hypothetical protein
MRYLSMAAALALLGTLALLPGERRAEAADAQGWGTVKGQVVLDGQVPEPKEIDVSKSKDKAHCLSKGKLYSQEWVVNSKNKGVRWAFAWLAPDPSSEDDKLPIHPSLKTVKVKQVILDQPCCRFVPHCIAIREGQELVVKNSAPVQHNVNFASDELVNKPFNVLLPPGGSKTASNLKAQKRIIPISCNIHPWMSGWAKVFDHPYYAITDEDGKFEIKLAPAGKYRLIVWQEGAGWLGGAKGKNGMPITIKADGVTDVGKLGLKPD